MTTRSASRGLVSSRWKPPLRGSISRRRWIVRASSPVCSACAWRRGGRGGEQHADALGREDAQDRVEGAGSCRRPARRSARRVLRTARDPRLRPGTRRAPCRSSPRPRGGHVRENRSGARTACSGTVEEAGSDGTLGPVQALQEQAGLAPERIGGRHPGLAQRQGGGAAHQFGCNVEQIGGRAHEGIVGEAAMALVHRFLERVGDTGSEAPRRLAGEPEPERDRIGRAKTDARMSRAKRLGPRP